MHLHIHAHIQGLSELIVRTVMGGNTYQDEQFSYKKLGLQSNYSVKIQKSVAGMNSGNSPGGNSHAEYRNASSVKD